MVCFFFQAEDGIRDGHVTGVQTCALPISGKVSPQKEDDRHVFVTVETTWLNEVGDLETANVTGPAIILNYPPKDWSRYGRSEERRVGKECRAGWSAEE